MARTTSRDFAKKGSLRSPRSRLVASLTSDRAFHSSASNRDRAASFRVGGGGGGGAKEECVKEIFFLAGEGACLWISIQFL